MTTHHQNGPRDRNDFLAALAPAEYDWLRPQLTPYELQTGKRLHYCGDEVEEVIFPQSGLVALSVPSRDESGALVLMVGRDGFVGGLAAAAGAPATCDAEVHIAGEASRISASAFRRALDEQPGIRRTAARFDSLMLAQAQQTALCNAAHPVEARVCRWLLEVYDRSGSPRVPLTQSTLAQMLGVRRTTVTLVAGRLRVAGVLNCRRGSLQIQSREKLEQHSCECYGQLRSQAKRLAQLNCGEAEPPLRGATIIAAVAAAKIAAES
jgi:CRP-like cAMP-binding protein